MRNITGSSADVVFYYHLHQDYFISFLLEVMSHAQRLSRGTEENLNLEARDVRAWSC